MNILRKLPAFKTTILCLAGAVSAACLIYLLWLPDVRELKTKNPKTTAFIELRREQAQDAGKRFAPRMRWTPIGRISPHLINAVIVAEDRDFYRHGGIDWELTIAALKYDIRKRKFALGASTITQQLARNIYLSPSKNPLRKIKELLIAWRMEKHLGKRRILELYLNVAEWGKGVFGAGAAAETYFGKAASDLDMEEAGALASVLPSPRKWNPRKKSGYAHQRARDIIRRMKRSGYLDDRDGTPDTPSAPAEETMSEEEAAALRPVPPTRSREF